MRIIPLVAIPFILVGCNKIYPVDRLSGEYVGTSYRMQNPIVTNWIAHLSIINGRYTFRTVGDSTQYPWNESAGPLDAGETVITFHDEVEQLNDTVGIHLSDRYKYSFKRNVLRLFPMDAFPAGDSLVLIRQ